MWKNKRCSKPPTSLKNNLKNSLKTTCLAQIPIHGKTKQIVGWFAQSIFGNYCTPWLVISRCYIGQNIGHMLAIYPSFDPGTCGHFFPRKRFFFNEHQVSFSRKRRNYDHQLSTMKFSRSFSRYQKIGWFTQDPTSVVLQVLLCELSGWMLGNSDCSSNWLPILCWEYG